MKAYRSILHDTCLVGGRHQPGSQLAHECPLLRAAKRRGIGSQGVDTGLPSSRVTEPLNDDELESKFRDGAKPSALPLARARRRVGRPASTEPSRHARYRRRHADYRAREASRKSKKRLVQKPMASVTSSSPASSFSASSSPIARGRLAERRRCVLPPSSLRTAPGLRRQRL